MTRKVSESEAEVLSVLMRMKQATAVELHEEISRTRKWAHATVLTFLRRLETKGLVQHRRDGQFRAFIYRPTRHAAPTRRSVLRNVLMRVFGGTPLPLVSSLLEERRLSEDDIAQLRQLIDHHAAGRKK